MDDESFKKGVKGREVKWSAVNWGEGCCGMSVAFMCSYVWVLLYSSIYV